MRRTEDLLHFLGWNVQGDLGPWTFYTSRRKGLVWFVKAPPLKPPSLLQSHYRNKFRLAGYVWRLIRPQQRTHWLAAAKQAHLSITGYNLFVYWITRQDHATINTIARLTGRPLLPLLRL